MHKLTPDFGKVSDGEINSLWKTALVEASQ